MANDERIKYANKEKKILVYNLKDKIEGVDFDVLKSYLTNKAYSGYELKLNKTDNLNSQIIVCVRWVDESRSLNDKDNFCRFVLIKYDRIHQYQVKIQYKTFSILYPDLVLEQYLELKNMILDGDEHSGIQITPNNPYALAFLAKKKAKVRLREVKENLKYTKKEDKEEQSIYRKYLKKASKVQAKLNARKKAKPGPWPTGPNNEKLIWFYDEPTLKLLYELIKDRLYAFRRRHPYQKLTDNDLLLHLYQARKTIDRDPKTIKLWYKQPNNSINPHCPDFFSFPAYDFKTNDWICYFVKDVGSKLLFNGLEASAFNKKQFSEFANTNAKYVPISKEEEEVFIKYLDDLSKLKDVGNNEVENLEFVCRTDGKNLPIIDTSDLDDFINYGVDRKYDAELTASMLGTNMFHTLKNEYRALANPDNVGHYEKNPYAWSSISSVLITGKEENNLIWKQTEQDKQEQEAINQKWLNRHPNYTFFYPTINLPKTWFKQENKDFSTSVALDIMMSGERVSNDELKEVKAIKNDDLKWLARYNINAKEEYIQDVKDKLELYFRNNEARLWKYRGIKVPEWMEMSDELEKDWKYGINMPEGAAQHRFKNLPNNYQTLLHEQYNNKHVMVGNEDLFHYSHSKDSMRARNFIWRYRKNLLDLGFDVDKRENMLVATEDVQRQWKVYRDARRNRMVDVLNSRTLMEWYAYAKDPFPEFFNENIPEDGTMKRDARFESVVGIFTNLQYYEVIELGHQRIMSKLNDRITFHQNELLNVTDNLLKVDHERKIADLKDIYEGIKRNWFSFHHAGPLFGFELILRETVKKHQDKLNAIGELEAKAINDKTAEPARRDIKTAFPLFDLFSGYDDGLRHILSVQNKWINNASDREWMLNPTDYKWILDTRALKYRYDVLNLYDMIKLRDKVLDPARYDYESFNSPPAYREFDWIWDKTGKRAKLNGGDGMIVGYKMLPRPRRADDDILKPYEALQDECDTYFDNKRYAKQKEIFGLTVEAFKRDYNGVLPLWLENQLRDSHWCPWGELLFYDQPRNRYISPGSKLERPKNRGGKKWLNNNIDGYKEYAAEKAYIDKQNRYASLDFDMVKKEYNRRRYLVWKANKLKKKVSERYYDPNGDIEKHWKENSRKNKNKIETKAKEINYSNEEPKIVLPQYVLDKLDAIRKEKRTMGKGTPLSQFEFMIRQREKMQKEVNIYEEFLAQEKEKDRKELIRLKDKALQTYRHNEGIRLEEELFRTYNELADADINDWLLSCNYMDTNVYYQLKTQMDVLSKKYAELANIKCDEDYNLDEEGNEFDYREPYQNPDFPDTITHLGGQAFRTFTYEKIIKTKEWKDMQREMVQEAIKNATNRIKDEWRQKGEYFINQQIEKEHLQQDLLASQENELKQENIPDKDERALQLKEKWEESVQKVALLERILKDQLAQKAKREEADELQKQEQAKKEEEAKAQLEKEANKFKENVYHQTVDDIVNNFDVPRRWWVVNDWERNNKLNDKVKDANGNIVPKRSLYPSIYRDAYGNDISWLSKYYQYNIRTGQRTFTPNDDLFTEMEKHFNKKIDLEAPKTNIKPKPYTELTEDELHKTLHF